MRGRQSVAAKGRAMLSGSSFRLKVGGSSGSQPGPAAAAPATGARSAPLPATTSHAAHGARGGTSALRRL